MKARVQELQKSEGLARVTVPNDDAVQSIASNLGAFFRHLFPGIFIIGAVYVAYPVCFSRVFGGAIPTSWQHLALAAVIALTAGNLWFAINRYVIYQAIDYLMYVCGVRGPAPVGSPFFSYSDDLGSYIADSVCNSGIPQLARQHVGFRQSSVQLLYIIGEVGLFFSLWPERNSLFGQHTWGVRIVSVLIFLGGIWQHYVTRHIDHFVVERAKNKKSE